MDEDGTRAASGTVLPSLVGKTPHFINSATEEFGPSDEQEVWPHAQQALEAHAVEDVLATAVSYTSWAVVRDIPEGASVLVTGGGATLMQGLKRHRRDEASTGTCPIRPRQRQGSTGVRVAAFFVGWTSPTLPSVTGARAAMRRRALGCWTVERRVLSEWEVTRAEESALALK